MSNTGASQHQVLSRAFQLPKRGRGEENEGGLTLGRVSETRLGEGFVQSSSLLVYRLRIEGMSQ